MYLLKLLKTELYKKYNISKFYVKRNNITDKTIYLIEINSLKYKVIFKPEIFYLKEIKKSLNNLNTYTSVEKINFYNTLCNIHKNFYNNNLKNYNFISQIKYETENFYLCEYFSEYVTLEYKHFLLENKKEYLKYNIFKNKFIDLNIIKNSTLYIDIENSISNLIKNEEITIDKFTLDFYNFYRENNNIFNSQYWESNSNVSIIPNVPSIINCMNDIHVENINFNNIMVKIENNNVIDWKLTDILFLVMPMPVNYIANF
jgi:hypothetical protein